MANEPWRQEWRTPKWFFERVVLPMAHFRFGGLAALLLTVLEVSRIRKEARSQNKKQQEIEQC